MADEPSNAELAWRLEAIQRVLGELVSRAEYAARLETAEHRFAELAADVAEVRRAQEEHAREHREARHGLRTIVYTGVIPSLVAAASILVSLWLGGR